MDEAHFSTLTVLGKSWFACGAYIVQKITSYGKRCACFAALGKNGTIFYEYYKSGNTENMIDFVSRLYNGFGKVVLVMDNASYHRSKDLMKHLDQYGNDVIFVYQPAYSPDLNPVEMVWKELKCIANGLYRDVEDLTYAMDAMLNDGTVILPNLPKYALNAIKLAAA